MLVDSIADGITYKKFVEQKVCTWKTTGTVTPGTLGKMFDCTKVFASVEIQSKWTDWDAVDATDLDAPDQNKVIDLPDPGQIVVVRLFYPVRPMLRILAVSPKGGFQNIKAGLEEFEGQKDVYVLTGVTAFRVEPAP